MKAQIRPNRLDISDRFPLASFTIRTDGQPRQAEIVVATSPELFTNKEGRTRSTFYSTREQGVLALPRAEAVYTLPPEVLARFTDADKLWFGLATAAAGTGDTGWSVDVMPTGSSPYISLSGLTDSSLRRVRMFPRRTAQSGYANGGGEVRQTWAGDAAQPGMSETGQQAPATNGQNGQSNGSQAPGATNGDGATNGASNNGDDVTYDDGFGPLPSNGDVGNGDAPQAQNGNGNGNGNSDGAAAESQGAQETMSDAERDRLDDQGIDGPLPDAPAEAQAIAMGDRPRALTAVEYPGAQLMASPAYSPGRRDQSIDRIVIHITDAPQSRWVGSWFTREAANSSSHYMVDQNGAIRQFVREQDTAWHAGNRTANRRSIGIEHVAVKRGGATYGNTTYPHTPPSDAEYRASAQLVAHLCRKYSLSPNRTTIIGHNEANPNTGHSSCPTGAWDWDAYMVLVAEEVARIGGVVGGVGAQALGISQTINWDMVQVVPQPTNKSCWATAGAMLFGWKMHQSVTPATIADFAGKTTEDYLNAGRFQEFADSVGLDYDYGQSYMPEGFFQRLERVGPLLVLKNNPPILHCVIVTGMYKDGDQWMVRVTDPWDRAVGTPGSPGTYASSHTTGSRYIQKYEDFVAEYEGAAGVADLQVLHAGGHYNHTPNYGPATPEGYAMGAGSRAMGDEIPLDPGAGGMSIGTSALKPGDLIVTTTASPVSGVIRAATQQPVSHVMMFVGQGGQVVEARGDGVRLKPLAEALQGATLAVAYRSPSVDEMKGLEISSRAGAYLDSGFDFVGIAKAGFFRLAVAECRRRGLPDTVCRSMVAWNMDGSASEDRFFCSALVLRAYDDAGVRLTVTAPNWASPGDIPEYTLRDGLLEYVGHLIAPPIAAPSSTQSYSGAMGAGQSQTLNWDDVQMVAQPTGLSCWATSAAMVNGWRDRMSVTPQSIADIAQRNINQPISGQDFDDFATEVGLTYAPAQSLPPEEWFRRLEEKGPLFVAEIPSSFGHVVVVTGMYNDGGNWYVRITDPLDRVVGTPGSAGGYSSPPTHSTGSRYILTFDQFMQDYERAAPHATVQVLHANGTHGHTPNRGASTPQGYAMAGAEEAMDKPQVPAGAADGADPAAPPVPTPAPSLNGGATEEHPFGPGITVTRQVLDKGKRRYELAQLRGFVNPQTGMQVESDALRAEPALLDDWPYIDGPSGRTQAGVAIDWAHKGGAVGEIGITPLDGTSPNGWDVLVRADLLQGNEAPGKAQVKVRVTTTFRKQGEADQVAVSEVTLDGDGRSNVQHGVGETGESDTAPAAPATPTPTPAPQPVEA